MDQAAEDAPASVNGVRDATRATYRARRDTLESKSRGGQEWPLFS